METPEICFTIKFLSCTNTLGAETYTDFEVSFLLLDKVPKLHDRSRSLFSRDLSRDSMSMPKRIESAP